MMSFWAGFIIGAGIVALVALIALIYWEIWRE